MAKMKKDLGEIKTWLAAIAVVVLSTFLVIQLKNQPAKLTASGLQKSSEINFSFFPESLDLKKGETKEVNLFLNTRFGVTAGGLDIVLNFNPKNIKIVQSTAAKILPTIVLNNKKEKEGEIIWTFLDDKSNGVFLSGQEKILTLSVKGLKTGESELLLVTKSEGVSTVVAENKTGRKIPFEGGSLKVVVK